jgi:very-short-patch-repair endonuclease
MQGVFDTILKEMFKGVEYEFKFHPDRKWRFDFAWPHARIALEIEGGVWTGGRHTRGSGFLRDMDKYNAAGILGWRVFRATPQQVKNGQAIVLLERIFEKRVDEKARKYQK